ncbi:hypothetical protein CQA62_06070 [Helicobacter cholecystus]|uniref:Uncharacterized protein n=1 Tax=Helicobacter cholecystus TaxID=45498 RepID=A0A3D8IUM3_9HELI|nr:hypothetical protein CQA62_06070 [Helicobacter cholecystus]
MLVDGLIIRFDGKERKCYSPLGEYPAKALATKIGLATFVFKKGVIKKANHLFSQLFPQSLPHLNNIEDALKPFAITLLSETYLGIEDCLYFVQNNPQSMTANCNNPHKNKKMVQDIYLVSHSMLRILESADLSEKEKKQIKKKIKVLIATNICAYSYIYYHSKAYSNQSFAYPINFLKSLYYTRSLKIFSKTLIRVFVYSLTLGLVRL